MNLFKDVAEFFTPVLKESHFHEKGVLTPEEFVAAGDLLVHKCGTWQWSAGNPSMKRDFLPDDKQFLITKNVPSLRRADTYSLADAKEDLVEDDDGEGWLSTHADVEVSAKNNPGKEVEEIDEIEEVEDVKTDPQSEVDGVRGLMQNIVINENYMAPAPTNDEEVPDMDDFEEEEEEEDDAAVAPPQVIRAEEPDDNIVKTRRYDISITYDKYYRTPRLWLFGYDENSQPLSSEQVMEDISADHANKTVTMETLPHTGVVQASIHPCKHASVMKTIVGRMQDAYEEKLAASGTSSDGKQRVRVDQYLFIFLKFMASVIPTIEYDFTVMV